MTQDERDLTSASRLGALSLGRRSLLRAGALGGAGLAAAALVGCGSDEETEEPDGPSAGGTVSSGGTESEEDVAERDLLEQAIGRDLPYPYDFQEPEGEPKAGGTMTVGATWDVGTMDVTQSAAGGTITIPNMVYNRLLKMPAGHDAHPTQLELQPELAREWERSEDGMAYTFTLQEGVTWQNLPPLDGRAFTAEDLKYAYERYQADGVHRSYWANVDSIDAVDEHTLRINMARPIADFLMPLGSRYQTIFPRELVESGELERTAIGTGPMILSEAVTGSHALFSKNPDYWERDVLLDGVRFNVMPDAAARLAAFRAGQIEYGYAIASTQADVEQILGTNPDARVTMLGGLQGTYGFGMNVQNPKFQDARVRRALSLATDNEAIMQILYEGQGVANLIDIPWTFLFENQDEVDTGEWFRYAPEEAQQLLDAAGASDLVIDAVYYTYGTYDQQRSELLTDQWRQIGVTLNAERVDYTEFNSQWVPGNLQEATTSGWAAVGFDADNYFYNQLHSESPGNRWKINDPQIDEWAEAQQVELDPAARQEIQRQIWDRLHDEAYRIPSAAGFTYELYQPWLREVKFGGAYGSNSYYYDWGMLAGRAWLDR